MLSQKQILRKFAIKSSCNPVYATLEAKCDDETASVTQTDQQSIDLSESTNSDITPVSPVGSCCTSDAMYDENYRTTPDHIPLGFDSNIPTSSGFLVQSPTKKCVRFLNAVRVRLIPCRKELKTLRDSIWWSEVETGSFKLDAYMEIKQFIELNRCTLKAAMFVMYQPVEMQSMLLNRIDASRTITSR